MNTETTLKMLAFNPVKDGQPFNNCNSKSNWECDLFNRIHKHIKIIFDIGCRTDSEMINFEGICHYFDTRKDFIDQLSLQKNINKISYFNPFGLGNEEKDMWYYPRYQSFLDRTVSCRKSDRENKILLKIKTAKEYIEKNNIEYIDFVKIDT